MYGKLGRNGRMGFGSDDSVKVANGFRGTSGRGEDGTFVVFEDFKPMGYIFGVVVAWHDGNTEVSTLEGTEYLSAKFFEGIAFVTKTSAKVAVEAVLSAC